MQIEPSIPQHRKVYEILRKHITDGVFAEGDLLLLKTNCVQSIWLLVQQSGRHWTNWPAKDTL